ncbi:RagB/SusD family nutrient uptake outer membrane protein [Mucilaginibacter sp. 21P]|uniref:RagB/SusD family nutrient uptake outer membrane protein n=1 Tax=Mucilaginibacter sp. 21P TaxID=2778902 RepID=UPI001C574632|nr:RagB/SusD family nutrient uptake outer membrane protein [Mucilaginibacter sp. 21P]QXV64001.1 RagB/SusD family nutrient uptake outer membrane protein [Mucilaginibacter sp. 21P]
MVSLLTCFTLNSCKKYLEAKPDQSIATPSTPEDLEGILNNYNFINARYPLAGEIASDNYYLKPGDYNALLEYQRNFYTWQKYGKLLGTDYMAPYNAIEYANVILDALPKISITDESRKQRIEGSALYIRAAYHYALAQLFCGVYRPTSADKDLGIAVRLTADIADKPVRTTVAKTYAAIIADLQKAIPELPPLADTKFHVSRCAAYGLLARVYLSMSDATNAGKYADAALAIYSTLIDLNKVNANATVPFPQFNDEVIYDARVGASGALQQSRARIDTVLYAGYAANDLRKAVYYKNNTDGSKAFKGTYSGQANGALFTGIATDELYLISAEAKARTSDVDGALQRLNALLSKRWKAGTFTPVTGTDATQVLTSILEERRKELPFRTLRWTDLRRLNEEPARATTLYRNISGTLYTLKPGDLRYVFQIDEDAVRLSGLEQNP